MTSVVLAQFAHPETLLTATRRARDAGYRLLDAFSPFPIQGLAELLGERSTRLRTIMLIGGTLVAALAYGLECWSAIFDYPINSGGRPLNSWPTFMLFPFAIGILGAGVAGFIALLAETRLPRLHHPLFEIDGFQQVSRVGFMLAIELPDAKDGLLLVQDFMRSFGAVAIWKVEVGE